MKFRERDISTDADARKALVEKYGKIATPALVVGEKMLLGFRQNRDEIERLIDGISGRKDD